MDIYKKVPVNTVYEKINQYYFDKGRDEQTGDL